MLGRALTLVAEAVFPARCIGCTVRGTQLCRACRANLPYLPGSVCWRCAGVRGPRGVCRGCRWLSPAVGSVRAAFVYEGAARSAVLTLKFKSGRYLAPLMGELLGAELDRRPVRGDVVVPVPLAPARLRDRGFNQAALLADQVAGRIGAPVVDDTLGRHDRRAQRTLGAAERLANLAGAFTCRRPEQIQGRRVVLVDDVITTGATVSACAEVLRDAGARGIVALAFARDL